MNTTDIVVHTDKTRNGLRLLNAGIRQAVGLTLRSAVEAAKASAKGSDKFHDKTGGTRASIRGEVVGLHGFVSAAGAAGYLEWGTRPHVISGNPVLRFVVNGQVLFRRWVRHPGTKERPFMREARERGAQAAMYGAEFFVGAAIARVR